MTAGRPIRVLLGNAASRVRLHLRRLLREAAHAEVVGQVRCADELARLARHGNIDGLLLNAVDDAPAAFDLMQLARTRRVPMVVLTGEQPLAWLPAGRQVVLRRPASLESEPQGSPFAVALQEAVCNFRIGASRQWPPEPSLPAPLAPAAPRLPPRIIAIGSSIGGPQALPALLARLAGRVTQPIIITQHMPAAFTLVLADHLERQTGLLTVQAEDGMPVLGGRVHLAPGGRHLVAALHNGQVVCRLDNGPAENFCKPAVDPMLRSVVEVYGSRALAVILTGMGQDGLLGCRALVGAGGAVLAQNEASSVVWGMPGAVAKAGLCQAVLPLDQLADSIIACAGGAA